ncbi:MAG: hypothetical protein EOO63_08865, partial [Hymenobacter sp.]
MMQSYFTPSWSRLALAALLTVGGLSAAQAQSLNYTAVAATNTAGTYTDLGTTGTVITTTSTDDANSAAQNIGFTFPYNGSTFTQFIFNTNGIIRLGNTAPSTAALYYDQNTASTALDPLQSTSLQDVNLLMPFNFDLVPGTGGVEYRVATTGTAPNRVCTIQWKNVSDKAGAGSDASTGSQYANFSFQLKLYETTAAIEFVYGPAVASASTAAVRFANVGIIGSDVGDTQLVLASKTASAAAWSTTTFQATNYTTSAHNTSKAALPDAGRTYRFNAISCPPTVSAFPYTENFDNIDMAPRLPCGTTVLDSNSDTYTWQTTDLAYNTAPNSLVYIYNDDNTSIGGNDWFFTPGLSLRAGYKYQLQFKYAADDSDYPEALEVKYGTAATAAAQTTTLFSNTNINNDTAFLTTTVGGLAASSVQTITPTANGTYYIGFHVISQPDRAALIVDDLQVTETAILAVRNPVNNVFTAQVAPVPFGSTLNVTLNTLKAGPLHLTMRDALGRVLRQSTTATTVGTSTVAVPEVANLAPG